MIRILDRLVVSTFLKLFIVVVAAAPPFWVIGDVAENLASYIDRGLTRAEIAQAYAYQVPLFVQYNFPIAALIAVVFTINSMTVNRELVAAKAGGISFHRLIAPIVLAGMVLTVAALGLGEVVPRGNRIAAQILRSESPGRTWRSDFVYQSEDGLTWQVRRLTAADGRMTDLILERPAVDGRDGLHVLAEAATYSEGEGWTLIDGYVRSLRPDSTERAFEFERMWMTEITEKPEELLETPPEPEEMTYAEIDRMARIIERTGGNAKELMVKREQKIAIPVATLVIILFGAPLATSSGRGGAAFGAGLSLAIVILYMAVFRIAAALGEAGALTPLASAWLPNAFFFAAAIFLLWRVRT